MRRDTEGELAADEYSKKWVRKIVQDTSKRGKKGDQRREERAEWSASVMLKASILRLKRAFKVQSLIYLQPICLFFSFRLLRQRGKHGRIPLMFDHQGPEPWKPQQFNTRSLHQRLPSWRSKQVLSHVMVAYRNSVHCRVYRIYWEMFLISHHHDRFYCYDYCQRNYHDLTIITVIMQ